MDDFYKRDDVSKDTVELTITIPKDSFKQSYDLMLKEYAKDVEAKGFRKGQFPTDMLSKEVKEVVKMETFEKLAPLYVSTAITKENLQPVAPPEYKELPKILEGLDITFTIKVTVMPEIKLGNLKKVKVSDEKVEVEEKEVDSAIQELKSSQKTNAKELNDDWAKEIGKIIDAKEVKSMSDLKEKIKGALLTQKEHMQLHKKQDEALKSAIGISNIEVPQAAVEYEAREREKSFIEEMKNRGIEMDQFLTANNVNIEKMRELWLQDSREALETDAFLTQYAKDKEISVSDDELNKRIEGIKASQPDADPNIFKNEEWKEYIKRVEVKEKAYRAFIKEVLGEKFLDEHAHS